jgi:GT2 family glycosyltransferase
MPAAVVDIELFGLLRDIPIASEYDTAVALLRWRGKPLMRAEFWVVRGCLRIEDIWQTAADSLKDGLTSQVIGYLTGGGSSEPTNVAEPPPCSVIICTRNRTDDLRRCLDSLVNGRLPEAEIIVVDNAPSDERTAQLAAKYPVRYTREMRKGLNWARALGARSASHDLLLYTDDDVVVDRQWIRAMCEPFTDLSVTAVTGLIMPLALETTAQLRFEQYGGFVKSFSRSTFHSTNLLPAAAGHVGAGASMAIRRDVALDLGVFDVELDCGTAALSGGDHYAFYRVLRAGGSIVFNPQAVCWHHHRRNDAELRSTLFGYSVGVYSFLLRCLLEHHDPGAVYVGAAWLRSHHLRQLWLALGRKRSGLPFHYTLDEMRGVLAAPVAYWRTRRAERRFSGMKVAAPEQGS